MTDQSEPTQDYDRQEERVAREQLETIRANNRLIAKYDRKYAHPGPDDSSLTWNTPGRVRSYEPVESGLLIHCEYARLELTWLAPDCVRVTVQPRDAQPEDPFSYAVEKTAWDPVELNVTEVDDQIYIQTYTHDYYIDRASGALRVHDRTDQPISQRITAGWRQNGAVRLQAAVAPDESCYGTGERAFDLNLRGRRLALWNTDPGAYHRGTEPINYCIPYYLGVHRHGVYGILWDNSNRGCVDLGYTDVNRLSFEAIKGDLRFYIFAGTQVKDVLARYTELTGRMPMPPLWAIGYHQSRYSYFDEQDVLQTANTLRKRAIPCDAVYLDIHYMDGYRVFTWDREKFPNFADMVDQLHEIGLHLVPIMDPGVKVDPDYEGYRSGMEADVFVKYPDGEVSAGVVWPGLCHLPDFSAPEARDWWGEQLTELLDTGIDGIWNDMNEPLYFGDGKIISPPEYVRHSKEEHGADHAEIHNVYGMLMGAASRAALERKRPGKRQFNIIRAGYAGAQRTASSWTGDNRSSWDHLRLSLSIVLNMALAGQSFTGPDVGGFADDTSGELLTRWIQAAVLLPFFRNHSAVDTIRQEPWRFGEPYESICRDTIGLRYRLLPYLYTAFAQCHHYGYPIVRPLFTEEPENTHLRSIDDCYMVGDHVLVAPVLQAHTLRRSVYLPTGEWYDFWTQQPTAGGRLIQVEAPLDRIPLFIRAGAALPIWPVLQHTGQTPERLTLQVYPGSMSTSWIYEDAGEGLEYQSEEFRWTRIDCQQKGEALLVRRSTEGVYQPPYPWHVEVIGADRPVALEGFDS